jgi:hypothetical protein
MLPQIYAGSPEPVPAAAQIRAQETKTTFLYRKGRFCYNAGAAAFQQISVERGCIYDRVFYSFHIGKYIFSLYLQVA